LESRCATRKVEEKRSISQGSIIDTRYDIDAMPGVDRLSITVVLPLTHLPYYSWFQYTTVVSEG
jgi:hypothetical protein